MRKIGTIIMVFSFIVALGCLMEFPSSPIVASIILVFVSFPIYFLGQILRTSITAVKDSGILWTKVYIFCVIILPFIFYSYEEYEELKWQAIDDGKYLFYEPGSTEWGSLSLLFLMALLLLIPIRLFSPYLKRKHLLSTSIIITIILYAGFQYSTWLDYRGVHQELGLISQNWRGKKSIQPFEQIEEIYVKPGLHQARLSDPSDETVFTWKMIFFNQNGEDTIYSFQSLSKADLESAKQLKTIARENAIPFRIGNMSEKEREWFDLELKLKELKKEPFYQFFLEQ